MTTFNGLIISGEGYHDHVDRGNCFRDLVQNKDQSLEGEGNIVSEQHMINFIPRIKIALG